MHDEADLLKRLQTGEPAAFLELVEQNSAHIYHLALRLMQDPIEAEEILQETFFQVVRHIRNFRGESSFNTWLFRIATNQALMKLRRRQPEKVPLDDEFDSLSVKYVAALADWTRRPERELLDQEARSVMEKAISSLPEHMRVVFILRDIENLSTAETAEALDLSISAVKSRLLRARLFLRNTLSTYFAERM